jgi:hypothetical protein
MPEANSKRTPAAATKASAESASKPPLPTLEEAVQWEGLPVDGLGNQTLGRVAGIHIDAEDGRPRWALIRIGPLAGCTAIPFEHVAEGAGRLWAAYERPWIREAPRFRPSESLTATQELELCSHWAVGEGQGRAAEVAGKDPDEITAIPAAD